MKILNNILDEINILEVHGNIDAGVSSVSFDSRVIEPHSLFVALVGNVTDGHNFIDEVIEKGATTIVYEKDLKEFKGGVNYIKVAEDTYPDLTAEFKKIQQEDYELFCKKQYDYR